MTGTTGTYVRQQVSGFSLIEVMISLLVFSIGLGGVALQLVTSVGGMSDANHRSVATIHASSLVALSQLGQVPFSDRFIGSEDPGNEALMLWRLGLVRDLPGAQGLVCLDQLPNDGNNSNPSCDGLGSPVVKIIWVDHQRVQDADQGIRRVVVPAP
jgi:prepilin-type N-terminal cleavage/methylation domain-containing protein